ncbi:MAG: hypothetical protein K0R63_1521 [Rickettsiales bacterium]|jgi:multicomponent Na+:H+ antiporter subunit B|nr:hypothetical protein [Rickettsiales bacterium]
MGIFSALPLDMVMNLLLLVLLCVTAFAIVMVRDLLIATALLGIFSLLMATMYLVLSAPDVAITEAAVGAGISTIVILCALAIIGREEKKTISSDRITAFFVVAVTGAALIYATLGMPPLGDAKAPANLHVAPYYIKESGKEIGIPNMVTSILASYRGFDTLGETFVIFTAAMSVLLLIGSRATHTGKRK